MLFLNKILLGLKYCNMFGGRLVFEFERFCLYLKGKYISGVIEGNTRRLLTKCSLFRKSGHELCIWMLIKVNILFNITIQINNISCRT